MLAMIFEEFSGHAEVAALESQLVLTAAAAAAEAADRATPLGWEQPWWSIWKLC